MASFWSLEDIDLHTLKMVQNDFEEDHIIFDSASQLRRLKQNTRSFLTLDLRYKNLTKTQLEGTLSQSPQSRSK